MTAESGGRRGGDPVGSSAGAGGDLPPACVPDERGSCSICGDEGRAADVLESGGKRDRGLVRLADGPEAGEERRVALDLVPAVQEGDRVIVHMGFAIGLVRDDAEG